MLGHEDSNKYESFGDADEGGLHNDTDGVPRSTHGSGGLLDYPHYTRPADLAGVAIPPVLTGGDHLAIRRWRREAALEKTARNRPELLQKAELSERDREHLAQLGFELEKNAL